MSETLLSVGIDIGTSTTQLILSRLTLANRANPFSVPRIAIEDREVLYRSGIHFTPLLSDTVIDAEGVRTIVAEEYRKSGFAPEQVDTGAVIITGETARKENAREVLSALSQFAGDFVVATAGPDLESILAARGAGADEYSREHHTDVLHFDIGGGTSNLALYSHGELAATGCLDVGGRLIKLDREGTVTYVSPVLKRGAMWASPPTPITRWAPCRGGCPHPPAPKTEQAEGADHRQWPEGRATMKVAPTSGTPCGRGGLYGRPDPRRSPTKWVRRGGGGATERVSVPVYGDAKDVQFAPTRKKVEALSGKIVKVSGPLVVATGLKDANMADVVRVGEQRLIGEILNMNGDAASIQVYEETSGLGPGAVVETTGAPMSVELGPGIIENIYDGIQRPLEGIMRKAGNNNLPRGVEVPALDREKKWDFTAVARPGDRVTGGDVLGTVQETSVVLHKIMVPPTLSGTIESIQSGSFTVLDTVAVLVDGKGEKHALTMVQKWPVRVGRPYKHKYPPRTPLLSGQRIVDAMFPVAKGGTAAIPGPFGSGKTVMQHQLAKWSDVDIVVYIGCGERGNEMTDVLREFPELVDPRTGESLMKRTVLIANTSDMPVAAREASIYTGITIAEYFRDMGYDVAVIADSTSRWAEALREISGRLEEMPADEGYPAYLPSRLAEFYERAGYVRTLNGAEGSVSVIGAVSPQGNDFSEPVTQNTKRFTRCFWALDKSLAYARHYPAINWNDSYSEYLGDLGGWYYDNVGHDFMSCRERIANLLLQENNLMQIVKLIGSDVLPDDQKLTIEIARVIRVGFLQQNAFHAVDTYVPLEKQLKMMETILYLYDKCAALVAKQVPVSRLLATGLFDELVQMKYTVPNDDLSKLDELQKAIDTKLAAVAQG